MDPDLINSVHFTPQAVFNLLHSLSVDKACGPDLIPARLLRDAERKYVCHFLVCFNYPLREVSFYLTGLLQMLYPFLSVMMDTNQLIIDLSALPP